MGALDELRTTGRLGPQGAVAVYRAFRVVAHARNFPPPPPHGAWDDEAVEETAHRFLVHPRTPGRLTALSVEATDDRSFEAQLVHAVVNFLRDEARRTPVGRLVRRLNDVLRREEGFVRTGRKPACWALVHGPWELSTVPHSELASAAAAEPDVQVVAWGPGARRAGPTVDRASLLRLCRRVLERAEGSLPVAELARAIGPRAGVVVERPPAVPRSESSVVGADAPPTTIAVPEREALSRMRAQQLFGVLDDRERRILATWEEGVRAAAPMVGVGRSRLSELRRAMARRLRDELADEPDADLVVVLLAETARRWLDRTPPGDSPSVPG